MELMNLGGPLMWPLLAASIAVLAIVIERIIVFSRIPAPKGITIASSADEVLLALDECEALAEFKAELSKPSPDEETVQLAGEAVVAQLDARLSLLSALAKLATLTGLLGTVLGMIETFAAISYSNGGIDMTSLASGLWQALITTASGLSIAIPASLALYFFEAGSRRMARALTLAANRVLKT